MSDDALMGQAIGKGIDCRGDSQDDLIRRIFVVSPRQDANLLERMLPVVKERVDHGVQDLGLAHVNLTSRGVDSYPDLGRGEGMVDRRAEGIAHGKGRNLPIGIDGVLLVYPSQV